MLARIILYGRIKNLERVARRVKDPGRLQVGSMVRYAPETRPNIVCPHCEANSADMGEAETLEYLRGRAGVVWFIDDPRGLPQKFTCSQCFKESVTPPHFAEMCVEVHFKHVPLGDPAAVWAFPSELTIISKQEWRRGDLAPTVTHR